MSPVHAWSSGVPVAAPEVDDVPVVFDSAIPPDEPMGGGKILGIGEEKTPWRKRTSRRPPILQPASTNAEHSTPYGACGPTPEEIWRAISGSPDGRSGRLIVHEFCAEGHTKSS